MERREERCVEEADIHRQKSNDLEQTRRSEISVVIYSDEDEILMAREKFRAVYIAANGENSRMRSANGGLPGGSTDVLEGCRTFSHLPTDHR